MKQRSDSIPDSVARFRIKDEDEEKVIFHKLVEFISIGLTKVNAVIKFVIPTPKNTDLILEKISININKPYLNGRSTGFWSVKRLMMRTVKETEIIANEKRLRMLVLFLKISVFFASITDRETKR